MSLQRPLGLFMCDEALPARLQAGGNCPYPPRRYWRPAGRRPRRVGPPVEERVWITVVFCGFAGRYADIPTVAATSLAAGDPVPASDRGQRDL